MLGAVSDHARIQQFLILAFCGSTWLKHDTGRRQVRIAPGATSHSTQHSMQNPPRHHTAAMMAGTADVHYDSVSLDPDASDHNRRSPQSEDFSKGSLFESHCLQHLQRVAVWIWFAKFALLMMSFAFVAAGQARHCPITIYVSLVLVNRK